MRILAFTDLHDALPAVERALKAETGYDVVVLGGDLTTYGTPKQARETVNALGAFGKPLVVVAGNMDPPELDDELRALGVSVNGRGTMIGSVGFFGVSAAPLSPLHTPNEISEDEIALRAEAGWREISGATATVFVPHAPPSASTLDRTSGGLHVGSRSVRSIIEKHQPDVTICGHIHESRGIERIGRTQVVNCGFAGHGMYASITLGEVVEINLRP